MEIKNLVSSIKDMFCRAERFNRLQLLILGWRETVIA